MVCTHIVLRGKKPPLRPTPFSPLSCFRSQVLAAATKKLAAVEWPPIKKCLVEADTLEEVQDVAEQVAFFIDRVHRHLS